MKRLLLLTALAGSLLGPGAPATTRGAELAEPQANLGLTFSAPTSIVVAGNQLTYDAAVLNTGPAQAVNVETVFRLSDKARFAAATPADACAHAAGVITCTTALLDPGQSAGFTIVADVLPEARGALLTQATTRSSIADPNTSNNSRAVQTTIDTDIDLSLAVGQPTDAAVAGAPLIYDFTLGNAGRSTATGVRLTAQLPAAKFERFLSASPGASCQAAAAAVTCALDPLLPISATTAFTLAVLPKATLTSADTLLNVGSVAASEAESATANNFTSFVLDVDRISDLTLAVTATAQAIRSSSPITYSLTVANLGPSQNTNVVLTSSLALDHLQGVRVSGAECHLQGMVDSVLECPLGTLEVGETRLITVHGILFWPFEEAFQVHSGVIGDNREPSAQQPNTATIETAVAMRRLYMPVIQTRP